MSPSLPTCCLTSGPAGTHVPFRNSQLTRVLQNCLAGNSRTSLILNVSPSKLYADETIQTLSVGRRAALIRKVVTANKSRSVPQLEQLLAAAERRIQMLEARLQAQAAAASESSYTAAAADDGFRIELGVMLRYGPQSLCVSLTRCLHPW